MALDQYTRRQKVVLIVLVIVGAGMFTVTGAMMASVRSCSESDLNPSKGEFAGENVERMRFQTRGRVLQSFGNALRVPVFPDSALADELVLRGIPTGLGQVSLMDVWPRYHDTHIWMFTALADKARAAGVPLPSREAAQAWFLKQFKREDMSDEDNRRFYHDQNMEPVDTYFDVVGEFLMVQEYIQALLNSHHVADAEVLDLLPHRFVRNKADVYSMNAAAFEAEAGRLVDLEESRAELERVVAALAGAGTFAASRSPTQDYLDPSEDEKDEFRNEQLVAFDAIAADIRTIQARMGTTKEELNDFYDNLRGTNFRANEAQRVRAKDRLKEIVRPAYESEYAGREPAEGWAKWEESKLKDLEVFLDRYEVELELSGLLTRFKAEQEAVYGINEADKSLETIRKERQKELDAEGSTLREWSQVPQRELELLNSIDNAIESLGDTARRELVKSAMSAPHGEAPDSARRRIGPELERVLTRPTGSNALRDKLRNLRDSVKLQDIEKDLELAKMEHDDAAANPPKATATPDEKEKTKRAQYKLEAQERRLARARELEPRVKTACDSIERALAALSMRLAVLKESPAGDALLRQFADELSVTLPVTVADATKGIIDSELKSRIKSEADARQAEHRAFGADTSRRKDDLSEKDLSRLAESHDLTYEPGIAPGEPRSLKDLSRDPTWYWVSQVQAAKSFLDNASNHVGKVSGVIERPGFGHYLLRIRALRREVKQAPSERPDVARRLAVRKTARQLAFEAMQRIRLAANASGDAGAWLDKLAGEGVLVKNTTDFFDWASTVPGVNCVRDPDSRQGAEQPAENQPARPFFSSFKSARAAAPVGTVFLQGDVAAERPLLNTNYRYSVAMITGRSYDSTQLPTKEDELRTLQGELTAARIAGDPAIAVLFNPKELLQGYAIKHYPSDYKPHGQGAQP